MLASIECIALPLRGTTLDGLAAATSAAGSPLRLTHAGRPSSLDASKKRVKQAPPMNSARDAPNPSPTSQCIGYPTALCRDRPPLLPALGRYRRTIVEVLNAPGIRLTFSQQEWMRHSAYYSCSQGKIDPAAGGRRVLFFGRSATRRSRLHTPLATSVRQFHPPPAHANRHHHTLSACTNHSTLSPQPPYSRPY